MLLLKLPKTMPWFYKKNLQLEDLNDGWYSTLLLRINWVSILEEDDTKKKENNLNLPSLLLFSLQISNLILQTTLSRNFLLKIYFLVSMFKNEFLFRTFRSFISADLLSSEWGKKTQENPKILSYQIEKEKVTSIEILWPFTRELF